MQLQFRRVYSFFPPFERGLDTPNDQLCIWHILPLYFLYIFTPLDYQANPSIFLISSTIHLENSASFILTINSSLCFLPQFLHCTNSLFHLKSLWISRSKEFVVNENHIKSKKIRYLSSFVGAQQCYRPLRGGGRGKTTAIVAVSRLDA